MAALSATIINATSGGVSATQPSSEEQQQHPVALLTTNLFRYLVSGTFPHFAQRRENTFRFMFETPSNEH